MSTSLLREYTVYSASCDSVLVIRFLRLIRAISNIVG